MKETGLVSKIIEKDRAEVEFEGNKFCDKCGICLKSGNKFSITALNLVQAKPGERVEVEIAGRSVLWATLLIFIMPVIMLFFGYAFGGVVISFLFMLAYFIGLFVYDKFFVGKQAVCRVVKILS